MKVVGFLTVCLLCLWVVDAGAQNNDRSEVASKRREQNKGNPYDANVRDDRINEDVSKEKIIQVETSDAMTFSAGDLLLEEGQQVKFVIANKGQKPHSLMIATLEELKKQAQTLKDNPTATMTGESYIQVMPGETKELSWKFDEAGDFYYGCLEPGHIAAGMVNRIHVKD